MAENQRQAMVESAEPARAAAPVARPATPQDDSFASPNRWAFVTAMAAAMCWTGVLSLLLLANLQTETDPLAPQRLLFYTLVLAATLLTFVPAQYSMKLPHLGFEGVTSVSLLLYLLAFVSAPTASMLYLPEVPVYALFVLALAWSIAAVSLPFIYAAGQQLFKQRARRLDVRRARRQAYELGVLVGAVAVLAALQVLTWVSLLLLVLILALAELLFLARSRVDVQQR